jgi:hypothetical protein
MKDKTNLYVLMVIVVLMLLQAGSLYAVWEERAKLTALDTTAGDEFGTSVSISGDYAIIGTPFDDDKGVSSGSAYIFKRDGTTWSQEAKLTASDGNEYDYFGTSVSIYSNYAIVGAIGDEDEGAYSGSAYIFKYDGTTWSQQAKLTASDGAAFDYFGNSVSIYGNYAIVGAFLDNEKGVDSGSAYIFKYDGATWSEEQKLTASDGNERDHFGSSVSLSGDYAIVGADGDDDKGSDSGSAYIFKRDGTTWSQEDKLTASDGAVNDDFGYSVSISGDYAIVGAMYDDDWGSAYIFKREGTAWSEQQKLNASDGAENDYFGDSVFISGDYAIVGADGDDDKGSDSGSAYIFKYDSTTWSEQAKLTASDGAEYNYFGGSVSISGYKAIVGAHYDDDRGSASGSAYIWSDMPCWNCPWQTYGNTNGDDRINAADYFNFKKSYGTGWATHSHGTDAGQYNCCCDFNQDLKVNATDYFIFKKNYGRTGLRMCNTTSCL